MAKISLVNIFDDLVRSSAVLSEGIEEEFIKIVSQQEDYRQQWSATQDELLELRKGNAKLKADNAALLVKLKHARSEQVTEQRKRQKSENARLQLESQVALIRELLNDEDARNRLKDNEFQLLSKISHCYQERIKTSPDKRPWEPDISHLSLTYSDIDYTDDDELTGTVTKIDEHLEEEETPSKKLRKSYPVTPADPMIPVTPVTDVKTPPVNDLGKGISPVCLNPAVHHPTEGPPSGNKLQHQQVTRLQPGNDGSPNNTPSTPIRYQTSPEVKSNGRKPKNHDFVSKPILKMETCKPCGKLIRFARMAWKCRDCRAICHTDCKRLVPVPCIPVNRTPNSGRKKVEKNIEFYAPTVSPRIPTILLRCVQELERRGLNQVGLYRIPGTETRVRELKTKFLEGKGSPDLTKESDQNVICGILKAFLKQLSEPLLTFALHQRFMGAAESAEGEALIFQAVSELPPANRDTLAYLMIHLQKLSQSRECKMCVANIAKVFAPTLVGYSSPNAEPVDMLTEAKIQPKIVEKLLLMPSDYWNQFLYVQEENIRSPPYNPNTHNTDGTPKTPLGLNVPGGSMLGPAISGGTPNSKSIKKKGSILGRTPLTPKFGSKSKNPRRRPHHFFDSPMLK